METSIKGMNVSEPLERFAPDAMTSVTGLLAHKHRYIFACAFVQEKVVLDCACGMGYGSNYLKRKASMVIGGDVSREAIECAEELYKREGLFFLQLDACKLPFADNSFDVIVSVETIEHLEDYESFLSECVRVLKTEGTFICSTPNRHRLIFPFRNPLWPHHVREFTVREFRDLVSAFFRVEGLFYQPSSSKDRILALGGILLSRVPRGSQFKQLLRRIGPFDTRTLIGRIEISEEDYLSEKESVRPLKNIFGKFPRTIIALGKKRRGF